MRPMRFSAGIAAHLHTPVDEAITALRALIACGDGGRLRHVASGALSAVEGAVGTLA